MREKTRKVLWARSGNRCAVCKRELIVDAAADDEESVIGEECHIVSGQPGGPRYDPTFPRDQLDETGNLILLCRVHHKMVDDQVETYTADRLRILKAKHEKWVSESLTDRGDPPPVRIRRIRGGTPDFLRRLMSGQEVGQVVGHALSYAFDHDDLRTEQEVELIASFLQEVQDWGDLWDDIEAGGRVQAAFRISNLLTELDEAGFWVFGAREIRRIEGGVGGSSPWPVAILRVVRMNNPEVFRAGEEASCDDRPCRAGDGGED